MVSPTKPPKESTPGSVRAPSQKPPTAERPAAAAAPSPPGQPHRERVPVSAVYSRLLELCPPFVPAAPWEFLKPDADCRQCRASASDLLAALEREFGTEPLLQAGIAQKTSAGAVQLDPRLTAEGQPLVGLRDREGLPFDIVTSAGCLSQEIPLLQFWRDRRTRQAARESEDELPPQLFATPTLIDAVLLRSAGLAATPMTHLDRAGYSGLKLLAILTDERAGDGPGSGQSSKIPFEFTDEYYRPAEKSGSQCDPQRAKTFSLTLLTRSLHLAGGEISEVFRRVARTLAGAQRHLGIVWGDVQVWSPTEEELDGLAYCRELQSTGALREFLLADDRTRHGVEEFQDPASPSPRAAPLPGFVEARRKLLETRAALGSGDCNSRDLRLARENYERLLEDELIIPLIREGFASEDLIRANLLAVFAVLLRWLHQKLLAADECLRGDRPSKAAGTGRRAAAEREGKDLVAILDRVMKLAEQIRQRSSQRGPSL